LCDYYGSVYKFENLTDGLLAVKNDIDVGGEWGNCGIQRCQDIQSAYDANKDTVKGILMGDKNKIKAGEILIP
jgi:hypothetical protein